MDDIKLAGKKQNINPMWKVPNKESDFWENQHHSLTMYTCDGQGDGGPQGMSPNRRRRTREGPEGWHTQGEKDELTSCRGTVQSAWQKPPVRRKGGRAGLPKKWAATWCGEPTGPTCPCPSASRVSAAVRRCARVTGKAGENGQYSGENGQQLTLDKTVCSRVG